MHWSHFVSILQIDFPHVKAMNMQISGYVSITAHYTSYMCTWKWQQNGILYNVGSIQFSVTVTSFLQVFPSPASLSAHEDGVFQITQYKGKETFSILHQMYVQGCWYVLSLTYFPMYFVRWWEYFIRSNLVIYINSTNIPLIMIINRIYETQNLLLL
jgi:hypothetical protein